MKRIVFDEAIRNLIENDAWDREMIAQILKKRKLTRQKKIITAVTSAAAVIFIIISLLSTENRSDKYSMEQMITFQVIGTYKNVFGTGNNIEGQTISLDNADLEDDIDTLIDTTLDKR